MKKTVIIECFTVPFEVLFVTSKITLFACVLYNVSFTSQIHREEMTSRAFVTFLCFQCHKNVQIVVFRYIKRLTFNLSKEI